MEALNLDALRAQAAAIDAQVTAANEPPPPPEPEPLQPPSDDVKGIAALAVDSAAAIAVQTYPVLQGSYPAEVKAPVADKLAVVLAKYNIGTPAWLARWQAELDLAVLLGGIVYASIQKVKAADAEPPQSTSNPLYATAGQFHEQTGSQEDRDWRPDLSEKAA